MRLIDDWSLFAACRGGEDPDALFVVGAAQHEAKKICRGCPVRAECLAEALDGRIETGVWGGMTESERRRLLRRYPEVASWRRLIEGNRSMVNPPPTGVAGMRPPKTLEAPRTV
jgi:WhiB family transcriptional regulator, redox-sensing transcriptional regulator